MVKETSKKILNSSYKDPSGFIFSEGDNLFRQINKNFKENYDYFIKSGLYNTLIKRELLIPHTEVALKYKYDDRAYKILKPERIRFITYPYEWCFSELKDVAITLLQIQRTALDFGMTLRDANGYNFQFHHGKPILIDTLSFEIAGEEPWKAYKQFCEFFISPLALGAYKHQELIQLLKIYFEGIPLEITRSLLPLSSYLNLDINFHLHLHSRFQNFYSDKNYPAIKRPANMNKDKKIMLINSMERLVNFLKVVNKKTKWGYYYDQCSYSEKAFKNKIELIKNYASGINSQTVLDIGANDGFFSRVFDQKVFVISIDSDYSAIEKNYEQVRSNHERNIIPLAINLLCPSPGIGWENNERISFLNRCNADTVLALALIHHLVIAHNLGFTMIAKLFSQLGKQLIIEFIPKNDIMVQRLLSVRKDIFDNYDEENFIKTFSTYFKVIKRDKIKDSGRILFLMSRKKLFKA